MARETALNGEDLKRARRVAARNVSEGDVLRGAGGADGRRQMTRPSSALVPRHGVLVHEIVNQLDTVTQGHLRVLRHGQNGAHGPPDF